MGDSQQDKDRLIEALLQERDEMYLELSRLREIDNGAFAKAEAVIKKKDEQIRKKEEEIKRTEGQVKFQEERIQKLTNQLAWYRRKFWKPSSEKYIPQDPNQRTIDFDGQDVLPEEKESTEKAAIEINSYTRQKPQKPKKQPVRQPLPDHLRREEEIIEPEGI